MMVSGAQADFDGDFEDRAEAVRRALGGLAGARKPLLGNSSQKTVMSMQQPASYASAPATQALQTPVPRIAIQSAKNVPTINFKPQAATTKELNEDMKPTELYTPASSQASVATTAMSGTTANKPGATTSNAQDLLCQLRQTEKQPIRGFDTASPAEAPVTQPQRPRQFRQRDAFAKNGKKKTETERENDRLLDELEALGEPALEMPGETPIDMNQRLRKEATAAMLKHSFFMKKRPSPPASQGSNSACGDFTNRS